MDKKAKQILFSFHWSPKGWVNPNKRKTSDTDFQYAKEHGYMFDNISISHDEMVEGIHSLLSKISLIDATTAFISSLCSRKLHLRSCLGSYIYAMNFPKHSHKGQGYCAICGHYESGSMDLNVLSFERHKWGGVRHLDLAYAWFDLSRFLEEQSQITSDGKLIFREIIETLSNLPKGLSASKIQSKLPKSFKSNKAEREILLGILGICDILNHPDHPGFLNQFIEYDNRELPAQRFIDLSFPFCWYKSDFGVNQTAVNTLFNLK